MLARLDAGVSRAVAQSQLSNVVHELSVRYGPAEPVVHASAIEARAAHYEEFRPRVLLVLASAVLMFVLATLNVAAILIALAVSRQKEFTVRAALGASRFALFRQTLTEGLLLGVVGGAAGLFLGGVGTSVVRTVVPGPLLSLIPGEASAIRLANRRVNGSRVKNRSVW